jgi:phenylacetate-CoA ligase
MASSKNYIKNSPTIIKKLYYGLVPFHKRYGEEFNKTYNFITNTLDWSTDNLVEYQLSELKRVVKKCYDNVPYYHKLMIDYNVNPNIHTFDDINKLPILTKDIVRKNWKDLIDKRYVKDSIIFKTSGSTGEKFQFLGNDALYKREAAFVLRAFNLHNASLYDKHTVWVRRYSPKGGEPLSYLDYELNRTYISPFHISEATIEKYVKIIDKTKAKTLVTYPSLANFIATLMGKRGLVFKHITSIHCASEMVLPEWRLNVKNNLGIDIYAHYGMMEKVSFFCYTEIIDNKVIGTGFLNDVMPFIRYDSGDLAVPSEDVTMSYGSLPFTVDDFIGRQTDMITCSDGRKLAGVNFYTMMYKIEGVEMFQIIQKDINNIEVQFIPSSKFTNDTFRHISEGMKDRVGDCRLNVIAVTKFNRTNSGKFKTIVNES